MHKRKTTSQDQAQATVQDGGVVRNSKLGMGIVLAVRGDRADVRFQGEQHPRTILIDRLEVVPANEAPPASTFRASVPTCRHCKNKLNESQRTKDGAWKSCPKCSADNGGLHVFKPFPDAFGTTAERASASDDEGAQSWCLSCRKRDTEPDGTHVLCVDVRR